MYKLDTTKRFDKALKLCKKRGYPIEDLRKAIAILAEKGCLPKEHGTTLLLKHSTYIWITTNEFSHRYVPSSVFPYVAYPLQDNSIEGTQVI